MKNMSHQKIYFMLINDEVLPTYYTISKQTVSTNIDQTKVIQKIFSPDLSKSNDSVITKKQGDQTQHSFSKKRDSN